jgi:deazaflavin-dependent oxidoreductase (nitroreductase family)
MNMLANLIKKIVSNALGLFVYGELGDIESKRGIKTKHTRSQEQRFTIVKKAITRSNVWLLRISKGRLGNSFLGHPVLLLTSTGRKSGLPKTQPLFFVEINSLVALVASNGGSPSDPAWLLNVRQDPLVKISRNGVEQNMRARILTPEEKQQLWPKLTDAFPYWQEVSDRSQRDFPVVVLDTVS